MNKGRLALLVILLACLAAPLCADDVVLKDGRTFSGEIVKETADSVSIRTIGGVFTFSSREVSRVIRRADPRKAYRQKDDALAAKEIAQHLALGKWCMEQRLPAQARRQFELVLQIDPQHAEALELISGLAGPKKFARAPDVDITLTDSSRIKGRLINSTITLDMLYGTLRIPADQVTAITMGEPPSGDVVETATFKARGEIKDQTFIVDTKLGRLSVSKKDIKSFDVKKLTPAQLAEAAFQGAMRRLDRTGLDVMIVIDTTDSMVGTVKAFVADGPRLWDFIHKHVPSAQIGFVGYRDTKKNNPDDYEYTVRTWPMTNKRDVFLKHLESLSAAGGGDIPEAVFDGLKAAVEKGGWRPEATRVIILIGDAPPHKEGKLMEHTLKLVTDWNRKAGGVLHTIDTTGWNKLMTDFIDMARLGGGKSIALHEEKKLATTLIPLILGTRYEKRLLAEYEGKPLPIDTPPKAEPPAPAPPEPENNEDGAVIIQE